MKHDASCELTNLGYDTCKCATRAFVADATDEEMAQFDVRNRQKHIEEAS